MRINNNLMAMNSHRQLGANQQAGSKSMERLSSGLRINRAGDDAAGLAISEKMSEITTELTEGSYRVAVNHESAQMINNLDGDDEFLDNISIHHDSALDADGTYTIDIDMETVKDVNQINTGGIGQINVTDTAAGSYTISTSANIDGLTDVQNGGHDLYLADDEGAISNIDIASDSTLQSDANLHSQR